MDKYIIDAFEFCRLSEQRKETTAVAELPRLSVESHGAVGSVSWELHGGLGPHARPQLSLSVAAGVQLICQRCLQPFEFELESSAHLVLAKDEESADQLDELLVDEEVDVIVGSSALNVVDLIEDEVLLALPISPRHDVCGSGLSMASDDKSTLSPFAVLKNLKKN